MKFCVEMIIEQCLSLSQEYDFHVRWPTVRLLTILLTNQCRDVQENILVHPMGVSKLMDLLSDSREIIRNDVRLCCTCFVAFTWCLLKVLVV